MLLRIRFRQGPRVQRKRGKNRHVALALSSLLTPLALMACVLGLWRLAADFDWAGDFAIAHGFFSHWQVWLSGALILQGCSWVLNRYGGGLG